MSTIPAYTFGGITRPELFLDPFGNIVLTPAAQTFADSYGLKALYLGCPPSTPWPPISGLLLTTPVDTDAGTNTVLEGAAANTAVGVTASAHDIVGFPITYSLTNNAGGAFQINSTTGVVTVADPTKIDYESSPGHAYGITVQATDGIFTSSQNFSINVGDVAPTAPTDTDATANTVVEGAANGTTVGITAHSTDVNGPAVTYSLASDPSGGGFTINSSTGVVTVADHNKVDFESSGGSYTITVDASDGTAHTTQTFTIAVSDLPPVISSANSAAVNEGVAANTLVYTAVAADPAGGTVTYSLSGAAAAAFTINASTGAVTINAVPDFETKPSYSFTVKASDPSGAFNTEAVTIGVTDLAPVISSPNSGSVTENSAANTLVYTAAAADPAGGTVTYSLTGTDAAAFTINASTGAVTINAVPDFETKSSYSFNVKASDASGAFNTEAVTIGVTDLPPTIAPGVPFTLDEGVPAGTLVYAAVATDPAGGTVTYSLIGADASAFSIDAGGIVTINAVPDFETKSSYSFSVKASDASGAFTTQALTVNINDLPPVISSPATASVNEGVAAHTTVYTAIAADPAGGTIIAYALSGADAAAFTIDANTGVVTINATPDFETKGSYNFTIKASDASGAFNTEAVTLSVNDLAPVISSPATASVNEGVAANFAVYTAVAADPGGGTVTYALTGTDAAAFTIDPATGIVTINGVPDFETKNSYSFIVKASDASGAFNTEAVTVSVNDVAPVISSPAAAAVDEGVAAHTAVYTAIAADPAGGTVTYSLSGTDAAAFTIDPATGIVTLNGVPDFETKSSYSFNVNASDASGATNGETVTLSVNDLPPVISSPPVAAVNEGVAANTLVYTAAAADPAGGTVTYSLSGADAAAFTINALTGAVTINNVPDFETKNSYNFTVKASDAAGAFNTEAVTIGVNDLAPVISSSNSAAVNEGVAANTLVYTAVAADPGGGTVTYSLSGADASAFTINASTGAVTINAVPDFETKTSYSFTVKASDASAAFNTEAVTLNITDLPPIPPITDSNGGANQVANGAPTGASTGITAFAADPGGGTVTYSLTDDGGGRFTIDPNTGVVTTSGTVPIVYDPVTPANNSITITVSAHDPSAEAITQNFTIAVVLDAAPVVTAGHTLAYTENQAATAIDTALTVTDSDNATLAHATVHITGNYVIGEDVLGFTTQNGITGSFDAATGTLTLTGSSSVANYQTALASVTYVNTSDNPSGAARTVTIIANDGTLDSSPVTDTINVTPVNDPPVTTAGGTLNYTENQAATAIDTSVTVADVDSANMSSATVAITGNFATGQDILGFTNQNGITGSYNAGTGVLTLSGSSSAANYKTALDSVTYSNSSDNPSGLDRTVSYTVNDGALNSNTSTSTVHVTPVNDPPVVTFGAITGFTEPPNGTPAANSVPVTIAPALTISDVDSTNLTTATFVLNDLKPSDALSVSGHAGASGDIGGIHFAISSTASTETVTLTGTDTITHYNGVLDLIRFNNTSENPDTTARSYTVTAVDDGSGSNTGTATTTETVTAVDDPPTASVPSDASVGTAFSHTNLAISGLSVADIDAASGNVTATIASGHAGLTFTTAGLSSFTNNGSHTVTLTGTVAQVNTALSTLTYNSDDGFTGSDAVTLNVSDNGNTGTGGPLSSGNQTFHVGVVPQVFYIDNSAGGSNLGTQANPFTSIAAFNAANPAGTGDYVVLEHGTGTYSEANGINLADGVNLIGGSQTLQFTNPVTSVVVTANTGSGTDPVIKLTAGSADNGVDLLAGTTGHTIAHVGVDTTLGSGMGISDDGNNVGTVAMSNIVVNTAAGNGLNFTHGGTVTVTGTNHLSSGTGTALDISDTTIGSGNLNFQSISSSGGSADGIILSNTGIFGGLHVTGVSAAASGGTIANKTGADGSTTQGTGIYLNNTTDVELNHMQLNTFQNFGIRGFNVTGFTLNNSIINGTNGTDNAADTTAREGAVRFDNLLGSASITNSTLGGTAAGDVNTGDDLNVVNTSGTLNRLTVDNVHFGTIGINGEDGMLFEALNSATANVTVTNSFFTNAIGSLLNIIANNNSTVDAVVRNDAFSNSNIHAAAGAGDIDITGDSAGQASTVTYDVSHNTLRDAVGIALLVGKGNGHGTWSGTINANTIGLAGVANSGSLEASGIKVDSNGTGTHTTLISNNVVHQTNEVGIFLQANDSMVAANGGQGVFNATIIGNTVDTPNATNQFAGLDVDVGALASDNNIVNVLVGSATDPTKRNDFSAGDPANFSDVNFSLQGTGAINLSKNGSSSATAATVIDDDNLNPGTTNTAVSGSVNLVTTTPPLPPVVLPLLAASGGVQSSSPTSGEMHLTQAELDSVVAAAIAQWAAAGASASQLAALHAATFSIADLSGNIVGEESAPAHITIDTDADGHGWFVDPTPSSSSEFTHTLNAAGTDLLTDPSNAAAGHLDLLTTVAHEMGHVLGLPDSTASADLNDLMYISLVDGERRLPDATDVAQASAMPAVSLTPAVSIGPATPVVTGTPGNDTIDAGQGGHILVGGAGADNFVFAHVDVHAATPPPITDVADYSFAQGDTFDFSALTSPLHASSVSDALMVRALEDPSGSFATLQVNTGDCSLGLKVSNWVSVVQLDGAHAGDAINVLVDSHSAIHLAQIHVDLHV